MPGPASWQHANFGDEGLGEQALASWLKEQNGGSPLFSQSQLPTYIFCPRLCLEHKTFPEPLERGRDVPPENVLRLHALTDAGISGFDTRMWVVAAFAAPNLEHVHSIACLLS